jgi:hypothetical protein
VLSRLQPFRAVCIIPAYRTATGYPALKGFPDMALRHVFADEGIDFFAIVERCDSGEKYAVAPEINDDTPKCMRNRLKPFRMIERVVAVVDSRTGRFK